MFSKNNKNNEDSINRLSEEAIYEMVAEEVQKGIRREGLWVKAYAQAGGDETKAKAIYIELRRQSLIDEDIVRQAAEATTNFAEGDQKKKKKRSQKEEATARLKDAISEEQIACEGIRGGIRVATIACAFSFFLAYVTFAALDQEGIGEIIFYITLAMGVITGAAIPALLFTHFLYLTRINSARRALNKYKR